MCSLYWHCDFIESLWNTLSSANKGTQYTDMEVGLCSFTKSDVKIEELAGNFKHRLHPRIKAHNRLFKRLDVIFIVFMLKQAEYCLITHRRKHENEWFVPNNLFLLGQQIAKHALQWHNKPQYDGVTHFFPKHFQSLFCLNEVETKMLMNN